MKETVFINQNKKKWARFEKISLESDKDPDELSQLFIEITDDLAYAKTHYPKRTVRVYLNGLSQQVFQSIYKKRRAPLYKLWAFWKTDLPLELFRARKALLTSFLILLIGMLIGIVSTIDDPDFLGAVIGYDYVDLTESNIKKGKPMDIYGSGTEVDSFLSIALNNLRVVMTTFILGILFSVGSGFFLFFNGIMVGAFQWFFKVRGLLLTSFLTIWIHGAFEIPAIIIAGAAGITMGNGLIFPKTLTRLQSLTLSAKRGIKIMIGIIPIIIAAAFIEGYATRHTVITTGENALKNDWPNSLKWLIILSCFTFMVIYFAIYPIFVAKKIGKEKLLKTPKVTYKPAFKIQLYKIRTFSNLFSDSILLFSKGLSKNIKLILLLLPLYLFATWVYFSDTYYGSAKLTWWQNMKMAFSLDYLNFSVVYYCCFIITIALIITNTYYQIYNLDRNRKNKTQKIKFFVLTSFKICLVIIPLTLFYNYASGLTSLLSLLIIPVLLMPLSVAILEKEKISIRLIKAVQYAFKSYDHGLGMVGLLFLLTAPILLMSFAPIEQVIKMVLDWFLLPLADNYFLVINCIWAGLYFLIFGLLINIYFISFSILFFTTKEKEEAISLNNRLNKFGIKSKYREKTL